MKKMSSLKLSEVVHLAHKRSEEQNKNIVVCYKEIFEEICKELGVNATFIPYNINSMDEVQEALERYSAMEILVKEENDK